MNLDALPQILFEEHPHPAVIFEPSSLRILAVNEAAVEWYALSRAELLAMTGHELGLPEDTLDLIASHAAAAQNVGGGGDAQESFGEEAVGKSVDFLAENLREFGGFRDMVGRARTVREF